MMVCDEITQSNGLYEDSLEKVLHLRSGAYFGVQDGGPHLVWLADLSPYFVAPLACWYVCYGLNMLLIS